MGVGAKRRTAPVVIPRLGDPKAATFDVRDEHLMLLEAARHELEVEWTRVLAASDAASDHDAMNYPSTVAYLKHRMGLSGSRANRYVRNARIAAAHPATQSAWENRQISTDEAELMFRAAERDLDRYAKAEPVLLELVGDGVDETRTVLEYWRNDVDLPGVLLDAEEQLAKRRFDISRRSNGMIRGEFELPSLEGEGLLSSLDALMPPPSSDDERTTVQRRADALGDLARSFLDGGSTPTAGGERPHFNVHVDFQALVGDSGGLHETTDGLVLDPFAISQLGCDASVTRIVFGPASEVLDVGRRTRVVPAALRRAVVARDRHCVAPGCGRFAGWCDVHHVIPWAMGGETVVTNLVLVCRYHHRLVHLDLLDLSEVVPVSEGRGRSP